MRKAEGALMRVCSLLAAWMLCGVSTYAASVNASVGSFINVYDPYVSVQICAVKVLDGGELESGDFAFCLLDEKGAMVDEAENDEDGLIAFDAITFTEAGEFDFFVYEVVGDDTGISYDTSVYEVSVTVTADDDGALSASISDVPVFTNEIVTAYAASTDEDTSVNQGSADTSVSDQRTYDEVELGLYVGLLIAAIGGTLWIVIRKKQ